MKLTKTQQRVWDAMGTPETRCDPAGEVQRMRSLEEQVRALTAQATGLAALRALLQRVVEPHDGQSHAELCSEIRAALASEERPA